MCSSDLGSDDPGLEPRPSAKKTKKTADRIALVNLLRRLSGVPHRSGLDQGSPVMGVPVSYGAVDEFDVLVVQG